MILHLDHTERLPQPESRSEFEERMSCLKVLTQSSTTSGERTAKRNASVGGHERSRHLLSTDGYAQDVVPDLGRDYFEIVARVAWLLGLTPHVEADHVHVQDRLPGG